jgi:uncharacterized protein
MNERIFENYYNSGKNPDIQIIDIDHKEYCALIQADSAFWTLVKKNKLPAFLFDNKLTSTLSGHVREFKKEMQILRYHLLPSAVYVNPTERCNLNCQYCYIPEETRKKGDHMSKEELSKTLTILKDYFNQIIKDNRRPSIIFHGSEPMLNKEAVFHTIEQFKNDFDFGIQTNATLLDDEAIQFIITNKVGLGISLDGYNTDTADVIRKDWHGKGYFYDIQKIISKLNDYEKFNVLCTINNRNVTKLKDIIRFFHELGIKVCMLNVLRCTLENSRSLKPEDNLAAKHFIEALEESYNLYKKTGHKIIVANFANILLAILAPTARKLMCDISPCGGGRSFFSLSAKGDIFPCSEFIGLKEFNAGNIFKNSIRDILKSPAIQKVSKRKIEEIDDCNTCAIRHFCGSPCPAEAYTMNGGMDKKGAFCEFYEAQVRYAFRLIAARKENFFLYDNWDEGIKETFSADNF